MHMHAMYLALSLLASSHSQGQNPFVPPRASLHYAPDRDYDLINVSVEIEVDYPNRTISGQVVDTLAPLRNGVSEIHLHAGTSLDISTVFVNGLVRKFRRDGRDLFILTGPMTKGKEARLSVVNRA